MDDEEHEPHVGCIAVPLWDHSQRVIASVSITAILYRRMRIEQLLEYRDLLMDAAREISGKLGFRGALPGTGSSNGRSVSTTRRGSAGKKRTVGGGISE